MKQENRIYILFLEDMLVSMDRIKEYISDKEFISFKRDYKTVDAVIRNFEIIGEASKNIPQEIKDKYQQIPWKEMYYLRNKISHEYFGIDYEIIWDIATNSLPDNQNDLVEIINAEKARKPNNV